MILVRLVVEPFPDTRGMSWPRAYAEIAVRAEQLGCGIDVEGEKVSALRLARFCLLSLVKARRVPR